MKFDRLQASILNNADQSPSLYMALCMAEALFADIESACGTDLSHCPVCGSILSLGAVEAEDLCHLISAVIGEGEIFVES